MTPLFRSLSIFGPLCLMALDYCESKETGDKRRTIFAQIAEDDADDEFSECAIIEGVPYKYFLRSLLNVSHDQLRRQTNAQITMDSLMLQPGLYRGQVVTLARGVVLEISQAELPPEYGLPAGYTVLPAVFVDSARDIYALRILSPPGSKVFERLSTGIANDALPVVRMSGYFMKLYARKTSDEKEPPWRRPLLICAEPEFSKAAQPRKVWEELRDTQMDRLLPSQRMEAPGAEERMLIELSPTLGKPPILIDGQSSGGDLRQTIFNSVDAFKKRLPEDQSDHPAAVMLISAGASRAKLDDIVAALRAAQVHRIAIKNER